MKPRPNPQDSGTQELFRAKLRNIINLQHELAQLGELIDWQRLKRILRRTIARRDVRGCRSGWWWGCIC